MEAAKESIRKVVNMTEMLNEHMMLLEAVNSNISGSIQQLRDNIQLAREQANNVSMTVTNSHEIYLIKHTFDLKLCGLNSNLSYE